MCRERYVQNYYFSLPASVLRKADNNPCCGQQRRNSIFSCFCAKILGLSPISVEVNRKTFRDFSIDQPSQLTASDVRYRLGMRHGVLEFDGQHNRALQITVYSCPVHLSSHREKNKIPNLRGCIVFNSSCELRDKWIAQNIRTRLKPLISPTKPKHSFYAETWEQMVLDMRNQSWDILERWWTCFVHEK